MKKIAALLCLLLMSAPGCAGKFPADIWPALKACGTNDVSWAAATEVFADLVEIVNGNPAGEADLLTMLASDVGGAIPCLVNYFESQGGAVGAAAGKFKTGHAREMKAAEARGPSACRSPGDSAPKTGPTAAVVKIDSLGMINAVSPSREVPILSGDVSLSAPLPDLLIVSERNADLAAEVMDCGSNMRSVTPMAPGVVCLRNGVTFTEVLCKMKSAEAKPYPFTAKFSGSGDPWAEAVIDLMHALPMTACQAAPSALECDSHCGSPLSGLVTPTSCLCQRRVDGKLRWVPLATVAAR